MGQICTFFKIFFSFFCVLRAISAVRAHCAPPPRQIGLSFDEFCNSILKFPHLLVNQICTFLKKILLFFCVFWAISAVRAHCAPPPMRPYDTYEDFKYGPQ